MLVRIYNYGTIYAGMLNQTPQQIACTLTTRKVLFHLTVVK